MSTFTIAGTMPLCVLHVQVGDDHQPVGSVTGTIGEREFDATGTDITAIVPISTALGGGVIPFHFVDGTITTITTPDRGATGGPFLRLQQ